jgi:transcriptional regulator with XRE-family HTH domain
VADRADSLLVALGHAIRQSRTAAGLSQEELSLKSGVHRNYIGGVERGERRPTVATVARLAEALGVRSSDLLGAAEQLCGQRSPPTKRERG